MPRYRCNVVGCRNTGQQRLGEISFFVFPRGPEERRKDWISFARLDEEGWEPKRNSSVCSDHFYTGRPHHDDPNHSDYVPSVHPRRNGKRKPRINWQTDIKLHNSGRKRRLRNGVLHWMKLRLCELVEAYHKFKHRHDMAGGQVVSCPHMVLRNLQIDINLDIINDSRKCSICHEKVQKGGDLWLCLFRDCYTKVCCGEDDHRETHTSHYKKHTLFVAVRSMRVWCTVCKAFINVQGNQGTVREEDADDSDDDEEEIVDDGECRMDEAHLKANGLTGLSNQGNTCYMNAALQALSNTPPLTQFFLECGETAIEAVSRDSAGQKRLNTLSKAYHWLMQEMWDRKKRGFVAPNGVLYGIRTVNPTFRGNMQQDTQEFLRSFMDNLHEELKVKVVEPPPAPMCECSLPEQDDEEMSDADNAEASVPNVTVAAYGEPHNDVRPPTNESEAGGASSQSEGEEYETCDSGVSERSSLSEEATSLDAENNRPLSNPPSPLPAKSRIASASAEPPRTPSATSIRRKAQTQFRSIISDVFDGKILSSVECLTCNRISTRVEAFQDLSLPIPNRDHLNILHQGSVNINTTLAKCSEQLYSVENNDPPQSRGRKIIRGRRRLTRRTKSAARHIPDEEPQPGRSDETSTEMSEQNGPPRKRGRRTLTRGRLSKSATRQVPVDEPSEPQHQESKKSTQNESVPQVGSTEPEHQESQKEVDPPPGSLIAQSKELLNYPIVHPGWLNWLWGWLCSWFWGPTVSLHDCLSAFFSADELKGDNMYSCERCKKLRNGIKFSKLLQLPEVLCIHLKRFRHENIYASKITSHVTFPIEGLDLRPYLHKHCVSTVSTYDLIAVICHHGQSFNNGHYTTYALNHKSERWYEFDDQCVTKVSEMVVRSCEAYVLFYRKRNKQANQVRNRAYNLMQRAGSKEPLTEVYAVSKRWMTRFSTFAEPGPIDNTDFLCHHSRILPGRERDLHHYITSMPAPVWDYLYEKYGGGPVCTLEDMVPCETCANNNLSPEMNRSALEREFWRLEQEMLESPSMSSSNVLTVRWFNRWNLWIKGKSVEHPGPIDNDELLIDPRKVVANGEYRKISKAQWDFLLRMYGGGPEVLLVLDQNQLCIVPAPLHVSPPRSQRDSSSDQGPTSEEMSQILESIADEPPRNRGIRFADDSEPEQQPITVSVDVHVSQSGAGEGTSRSQAQQESVAMEVEEEPAAERTRGRSRVMTRSAMRAARSRKPIHYRTLSTSMVDIRVDPDGIQAVESVPVTDNDNEVSSPTHGSMPTVTQGDNSSPEASGTDSTTTSSDL